VVYNDDTYYFLKLITNRRVKILFVLLMPLCLFAQAQKFSEYEVKAAFLEKFTRFVEWPAEAHMEDVNKPFVIGIMGENPFNSILEKMYANQKIKNKKVEIRYISVLEDVKNCNLLFITQSKNNRVDQIQYYLKNLPILTVCDDIRYSKKGVQIMLFVESNHVYFEIDQNAVKLSGLYMNSLLLKMSKTINTKEEKQ